MSMVLRWIVESMRMEASYLPKMMLMNIPTTGMRTEL